MNLLAQSTTTTATDPTGAMAAIFGGSFLLFALIGLVIAVAIYYVILNKTGYNPWLSLLILIPGIGGLIILIMLVFTEWPIQRELRACRAQLGGGGGYGGGYAPPPPGYPPAGGYAPPPPGGPVTPA
jgi:hypothetical protein